MSLASRNSSFCDIIRQKSLLLHQVRTWFWEQGYLEVQTPILVSSPAMEETLESISCNDQYLHTSPEFAMKHLLAQGLCKIYQIVPCFRGEEEGVHHSTEFSMLEWYRVGIGTQTLMEESIALLDVCAHTLDVSLPSFERLATKDLLDPTLPPEEWLFQWVDQIEPHLPKACIVYDYPIWGAALSRIRGSFADRFEIYLNGLELANAFHEERDRDVLKDRWEQGNRSRVALGKSPHPIDHNFLHDIARMPRCSGIAMGIDRLLMALLNIEHIKDTHVPNWRET